MATNLLQTKLHVPPLRPALLTRERLLAQLDEALPRNGTWQRQLTLISAPAGYGKTTLAAAWIAQSQTPVAWLTLDSGDNDRGLFMAYLLNHLPPQMHLLLATRADPALPVVRLRGQGQVTEIRQADLRFTPVEARAFFAEAMDLTIPTTELDTLAERTEGWAAGLQMAALALQRQPHQDAQATHAFVRDFAGTHRHILDYLLEEVLERQPAAVHSFLLQTSILESLSAELCQAVVAGSGTLAETQAMLEYLEGANLFVVPLDDQRCWYRYHQLFADLLRVRLAQQEPALVPDLYRRAAGWYEEQGMLTDAVQAALAAGDLPHVASLAERNVLGLMEHGDVKALARWLDALPTDAVAQRSWLRLAQGWALAYAGRLEAAQIAAADVEAAASTAGAPDAHRPQPGHAAALHAYVAWLRGDHEQSTALARDALAARPVPAAQTLVEPLSKRELDVLQLLGDGRSNREIGLSLSISLATVKWHTSNIYSKLNVGSRTEAVLRAQQLGLLP